MMDVQFLLPSKNHWTVEVMIVSPSILLVQLFQILQKSHLTSKRRESIKVRKKLNHICRRRKRLRCRSRRVVGGTWMNMIADGSDGSGRMKSWHVLMDLSLHIYQFEYHIYPYHLISCLLMISSRIDGGCRPAKNVHRKEDVLDWVMMHSGSSRTLHLGQVRIHLNRCSISMLGNWTLATILQSNGMIRSSGSQIQRRTRNLGHKAEVCDKFAKVCMHCWGPELVQKRWT